MILCPQSFSNFTMDWSIDMSKYTKEQLSEKATEVMNAVREKDPRAEHLIMMLSMAFQTSPVNVFNRIKDLVIVEKTSADS